MHSEQLDLLETKNLLLNSKVQVMEGEHKKLQSRIDKIEDRALQHCLIFRGINEDKWEKEATNREKVYKELAAIVTTDSTFDNKTKENKFKMKLSRKLEIRSCKWLGRYNKEQSRPISVEMLKKEDVEYILTNKPKLKKRCLCR